MTTTTTNTLSTLNDRLFEQLSRLSDTATTGDKLREEIDRSKAVAGMAVNIIGNAKLALEVQRTLGGKDKPGMLSIESK